MFSFLQAVWEDYEIKYLTPTWAFFPQNLTNKLLYEFLILHVKAIISNWHFWVQHSINNTNSPTLWKLERVWGECLEMRLVGSCCKLWKCLVEDKYCYASCIHRNKKLVNSGFVFEESDKFKFKFFFQENWHFNTFLAEPFNTYWKHWKPLVFRK